MKNKSTLSGAQIIVRELINQNVSVVFGYPGAAVLALYDELYTQSHKIQNVLTAHEQGACHCADGYARVSGKTGVVIATSGPGATNLVTGIATAYLDSIPLVAITGNVSTLLLGKDSFQEVDIFGITLPIVKHSYIVQKVTDLSRILREAFSIASGGRPGPVLIDIPKDIQTDCCEYREFVSPIAERKEKYSEDILQRISDLINCSERPFIYSGGGVISADCAEQVLQLSKKLSAPIGLSMMGLSAIPHTYEFNLGMTGMHGRYAATVLKDESDLIIAIGARFSDRTTGNVTEYGKNKKIIHLDIDAAEFDKNVKTDIALAGNIKVILQKLIERISKRKCEQWLKRIGEVKNLEKEMNFYNSGFSPKAVIETVNSYCGEDTVIATDVGQHQMWVMQNYKFSKPRTLVTSGGLGTMGYGLGGAIGGCMASGKQTVLFTGDGSFGMNLNELATAVSLNLPLLVVIFNNGVLGMVRQWQTIFYDKRYANTTLNRKTDFVNLAKAFGAEGYRAKDLSELKNILKSGFKGKTVVVECIIDCDEKVLPMIPAGGAVKDIIIK